MSLSKGEIGRKDCSIVRVPSSYSALHAVMRCCKSLVVTRPDVIDSTFPLIPALLQQLGQFAKAEVMFSHVLVHSEVPFFKMIASLKGSNTILFHPCTKQCAPTTVLNFCLCKKLRQNYIHYYTAKNSVQTFSQAGISNSWLIAGSGRIFLPIFCTWQFFTFLNVGNCPAVFKSADALLCTSEERTLR
ncbi:hypothetical protein T4C_3736 [Trichinella pseudospiralis]|uniref:Uncharacterized protein n=1 Tax=Trichinella pseudospiralis TaxID=6337 RepID=A0A0V1JZY7_TRIPS|nr:hypothetical protein T4C_3736 [Trichinella pseudospiralis]